MYYYIKLHLIYVSLSSLDEMNKFLCVKCLSQNSDLFK